MSEYLIAKAHLREEKTREKEKKKRGERHKHSP
jgi:hypothetical protein